MSNAFVPQRSPRVLFLGMEGAFSSPPLKALLESNIEVCAVVVPASPIPGNEPPVIRRRQSLRTKRSILPLVNSTLHTSIVQIAEQRQIPIWEVQRLTHPDTVMTLAAYQPDILCVACFPLLIPRAVLDVPRLGNLNVHPSLLPANRGPVPLFWTFRDGDETTGVTIHLLNEGMDSGDILAQESIAVPGGISYSQLEAQTAQRGGVLLARTVWNLFTGQVIRTAQDEAKSSYHSFPISEDFVVPVKEWSARHVYNFIRGVGHWDIPVELRIDGQSFFCRDAEEFRNYPIERTIVREGMKLSGTLPDQSGNYEWMGEELVVRCKEGWVRVRPFSGKE